MALVLADRVQETTTTTGTGTVTLAGAVSGFQSFAVVGNANTTYYTIAGQTTSEFEIGIGTYTASGTTLSRDTILASSNSNSAVNFSAGTKNVFVTYPAGKSIYQDSSGNVGIGTTSPSQKLVLSNAGAGNVLLCENTTASIQTYLQSGGTTGVVGTLTNHALALYTNNTERMRIDTSGNVGIGNVSPTVKLDVAATTGAINVQSTTGTNYVKLQTQNTGGTFQLGIDNSAGSNYGAAPYARVLWNDGAYPTVFFTTSTERMRIDSSGNVGIGNSSPTTKLDVTGIVKATNVNMGFTSTATAAGTTTLTVSSTHYQRFTGTTTQTIVLPVTSTLATGVTYAIENASTGNLTVNSSGGNLVVTVIPGVTVQCMCIGTTLTTAADWDAEYNEFAAITGTGAVVLATSPTLVTPALGTPSSGTLTNCTFPTLNQNTTGSAATFTSTSQNSQFNSVGVGTAGSGTAGEIRATNNVTAYYSDERLKTKIGDIEDPLGKIHAIRTMLYHANEIAVSLGYDASIQEVGVSAQSVQAVQPEAVAPAPIDEQYLTVRYEKLVPLLIEAIKALDRKVDALAKLEQ